MSATSPIRVALVGSHGVGKTTLLRLLAAEFPGIAVLPETAREVITDWNELPQDMDPARRGDFQREVLRRQVAQETAHGSFLSDRGVFDTLAYGEGLPGFDELKAAARAHLAARPYTHVVLVPKFAAPADDGIRMLDEGFQEEIERRVRRLLKEFGVPHVALASTEKLGRLEEARAAISRPVRRPLRVALVGASGTGKSTFLARFAKLHPDVVPLAEAAREIIAERGVIPKNMSPALRARFEEEILERQCRREKEHDRFVSDGAVIDTVAYARAMANHQAVRAKALEHLAESPYTHAVFFPRMFLPEDDGVRTLNETHRKDVEARILLTMEEFGIPHYAIKSHLLEERIKEVEAYLETP